MLIVKRFVPVVVGSGALCFLVLEGPFVVPGRFLETLLYLNAIAYRPGLASPLF